MPGRHVVRCRQSQRLRVAFRIRSQSGVDWVFTDAELRLKVRSTAPSAVVLLDTAAYWTVPPSDPTRALLDVPAGVTAALPAGDHEYDLFVDDVPVLAGPFLIRAAASRPGSWTPPPGGLGLPAHFVHTAVAYTAAPDDFVLVDASLGDVPVTLPAGSEIGSLVAVKKVDASANVVTVAPQGGGTIDGDTEGASLEAQWVGVVFEHSGSEVWFVPAVDDEVV